MKIAIIDNYDSFTYNLVHYVQMFCDEIIVFRNDTIDYLEIEKCEKIIISPGPGLPKNAGMTFDFLKQFSTKKKILGVCLGMQTIWEYYGGQLINLPTVYHGCQSVLKRNSDSKILKGINKQFEVGKYHSWVIKENCKLPFKITSYDEFSNPMSMEHTDLPIYGVQFHPESIMTPDGMKIIQNWIEL